MLCAGALDWRINSFRERLVVPGTCTPEGDGWRAEMEEGRERDKQRQWRQGSAKEMEGEEKNLHYTAIPTLTK